MGVEGVVGAGFGVFGRCRVVVQLVPWRATACATEPSHVCAGSIPVRAPGAHVHVPPRPLFAEEVAEYHRGAFVESVKWKIPPHYVMDL